MSDEKHTAYCIREKEIATIAEKVDRIEKIVTGNGKEGLDTIVPKLAQAVERLSDSVEKTNTFMSGALQFQAQWEGMREGENTVRKRNRWIIGVLASVALGLLTVLIAVIS